MNAFISVVMVLNILAIIAMIFIERKKPQTIISWLAILSLFPILGFIFYVLVGAGLSITTKHRLRRKRFLNNDYKNFEQELYQQMDTKSQDEIDKVKNLINYNYSTSGARLLVNNDIKFYTNGVDKLEDLKKDILDAKHTINLEYFIFASDKTGNEVMNLLIEKAKQGVKVKLIYDSIGSIKAKRSFFRKLKKAGGEVCEFFPPFMHIRLINLKMNYRNHRKVVVIDGKIGYTGGINISDNHMGKNSKLNPWRDTHIRIEGQGVYGLQSSFLNHWLFCNKGKIDPEIFVNDGYFPAVQNKGSTSMQIIVSGPDTNEQNIKNAMVQMILSAKKKIVLETPYFVPDDIFLEALKIAHKSGVDVTLLIPKIPDKKIVYLATLSFAKELVDLGIKVFRHKGFLHSKVLMVDDMAITVGSCNADNRSFALNFELNAMLYGNKVTNDFEKILEEDIKNSELINKYFYKQKSLINKFLQAIMRLFAPLL